MGWSISPLQCMGKMDNFRYWVIGNLSKIENTRLHENLFLNWSIVRIIIQRFKWIKYSIISFILSLIKYSGCFQIIDGLFIGCWCHPARSYIYIYSLFDTTLYLWILLENTALRMLWPGWPNFLWKKSSSLLLLSTALNIF